MDVGGSALAVAVSADGSDWYLLNASPDIRSQILSTKSLLAGPGPRDTPLRGVFLTDAELDQFESKWRLGTRQRLAYALLLYTGQRVGDVVKMNRADISEGMIYVVQEKTGAKVWVPITPELERAMKACPAKGLTVIGDVNGRPIKRAALSALMRAAIKEAGLSSRCVSHGLRKAAMRRLAENDATDKQIAAVSGHKTLKEVERYTKAADQKKLARAAMDKLRDRR